MAIQTPENLIWRQETGRSRNPYSGVQVRGVRPIGDASAAFSIGSGPPREPIHETWALAPLWRESPWSVFGSEHLSGFGRSVSLRGIRQRALTLACSKDSRNLAEGQESISDPRLECCVLVGPHGERLHEFIQRFHDLLDEATNDRCHLEYLGNPNELGTQYKRVRTPDQAARDNTGARAYSRTLQKGVSPDHVRRHETGVLIRRLGIAYSDLPSIVFASIPACGRMAMLRIDRRWIATDAIAAALLDSLIGFFKTDHLLQAAERPAIDPDSMQGFESRLNKVIQARMQRQLSHIASRQLGEETLPTVPASTEDATCAPGARTLTREGEMQVTGRDYEELLGRRNAFHLFIDGMTRRATVRNQSDVVHESELTSRELAMLIEFIRAGNPMRPSSTEAGRTCASSQAARRIFELARKKVDVRCSRYKFRAFQLHKHPTDRNLHAFAFRPPDDFEYCLILPA